MQTEAQDGSLMPETSGLREHLGIRYVGMDGDSVVMEMSIGSQHLNLARTLHGGAIASLVDIACALAARTPPGLPASPAPPGSKGVATLSMTLNFTRAVREGQVRAVARRVSTGRSFVFAAAEVFDDEMRLLANGSGCYAFRG